MADDTREKFINPYTVLDFLDETKVNWESEASQKEYWDYTSTLETAERKGEIKGIQQGLQQGVQQEKNRNHSSFAGYGIFYRTNRPRYRLGDRGSKRNYCNSLYGNLEYTRRSTCFFLSQKK